MKSLERVVFSTSLVIVSVIYGCVAAAFGWFPSDIVAAGFSQANAITSRHFLAPRKYDRAGAKTFDAATLQPGLTLISSMWPEPGGWYAGLRLIDHAGTVLHQWRVNPDEVFSEVRESTVRLWSWEIRLEDANIHGSHLFADGDILVNMESIGSVRLDACSQVRWILDEGSHHSIAEDDDGSFWIPALDYWEEPEVMARSGEYPGLDAPLINNRILRVSPKGKVVEDISMLDVLYANDLHRYFARSELSTGDVLHVNDVEPLSAQIAEEYPLFEEGDLLVSIRNISVVLVLDPKTKRVKWHASHPFVQQHDPDFIGGGWVGVFDNSTDPAGGKMLGGSQIVALRPHTNSVRVLYPGAHSEPFYTEIMGKWQLLDNGNMLLTEARTGRVIEVDPSGRTVWEWINKPSDDRVAEVAEGTRYALTPEQVAQWPCGPGVAGEES